jgi:hypothetical protein
MRMPSFRRTLLVVVPLLALACARAAPGRHVPPGFELLRCEPATIAFTEVDVDAEGGTLVVRGHRFVLHPGAVGRRTRFRVRERETGYVGVDITPRRTRFNRPAQLTLSYAQCDDLGPGFRPSVVEVEHGGIEPVGPPMLGAVDSVARTVTVEIQHLSGYLIGTNRGEDQ